MKYMPVKDALYEVHGAKREGGIPGCTTLHTQQVANILENAMEAILVNPAAATEWKQVVDALRKAG